MSSLFINNSISLIVNFYMIEKVIDVFHYEKHNN